MTKALDALIEAVEAGDDEAVRDVCRDLSRDAHDRGEMWPSHDATKAYRGSLDAAKALHDAVLSGWTWALGARTAAVWLPDPLDLLPDAIRVDNASTARAWLIATLKAYRATLAIAP